TSVSPANPISLGNRVKVSLTATATQALANIAIALRIVNGAGRPVFVATYPGLDFTANQSRTYANIRRLAARGVYTVRVSITDSANNPLYTNNNAATITVQ